MSAPQYTGRIIVITGLSGSGKSAALKALEDNGYLAIDNLPIVLLTKLLAIRKESGGFIRLAVVMDVREPELTSHHEEVFAQARDMGYELQLLFLEASTPTLVKRFSETRRPHPLAPDGELVQGLKLELELLAPLRLAADEIIDTTNFKNSMLQEAVLNRFVNGPKRSLTVEVVSFGFKNGLPPEADFMVDMRFLPNPFYNDDLRPLDGRDSRVIEYVMSHPEASGFLTRFVDLMAYLLPLYQKEGKSYLVIAVGCTGGQHRSVAIAGRLWEALQDIAPGLVILRHRDLGPSSKVSC